MAGNKMPAIYGMGKTVCELQYHIFMISGEHMLPPVLFNI